MAGYIQSITPFTITIAGGSTSNTASIGPVVAANSVIFFDGFTSAETGTNYQGWMSRAELTNSTTVTAYRNTSTSNAITVRGTVVEFVSGALEGSNVQAGTITIGTSATSNTATISPVTTANSVVFYLGETTSGASVTSSELMGRLDLTNSTTVTATRNTSGASTSITVGYAVVDFNSALIQSIQQRSVTLTSSTTSDTDAISNVTTGNALLIYGGSTTGSATFSNFLYNLQLTGVGTVTLTRNGTAPTTRTINYTVLEFKSGVLDANVQRGTIAMASVTSNTAALSPSVSTSQSVCNWAGFSTNASANAEAFASAELTNATTVTGRKNTAGISTATVSYEVAEFGTTIPTPPTGYIYIGGFL